MCTGGKQRYEPDYTIAEEILGAVGLCMGEKCVFMRGENAPNIEL